jgi:hypothetical protein
LFVNLNRLVCNSPIGIHLSATIDVLLVKRG